MTSDIRFNRAGRHGFWIFFLGLLLMAATFVLTLWVFLGVDAALRGSAASLAQHSGAGASPVTGLLVNVVAKLAALLVMGVVASLLATQGLRLWLAVKALPETAQPPAPAVAAEAEESSAVEGNP